MLILNWQVDQLSVEAVALFCTMEHHQGLSVVHHCMQAEVAAHNVHQDPLLELVVRLLF